VLALKPKNATAKTFGESQGNQAKEILVVDACGARQNLQNEQNFSMG